MNTIQAILVLGRERIRDPKRWTQWHYARNRYGLQIDPCDRKAVCWCASGSLRALDVSNDQLEAATGRLGDAAIAEFVMSHIIVNDGLGHEAVMKIYDRAIEGAA